MSAQDEQRGAQASAVTVDDEFVRRAIDESDLNVLRIALYQATGDEDLARVRLKATSAYAGAGKQIEVEAADRDLVKAKALAYLRANPVAAAEVRPDDEHLRRLLGLFIGEELRDKDWDYRRQVVHFDEGVRVASWSTPGPAIPEGYQVIIVGAGYSGIGMAIQLEKVGIPYTVYERHSRVGGVWNINTYPDVRVDTANFIYQYSFEHNYPWTEYFPRGAEVRQYLQDMARKYGVLDHIRFNADVTGADFDDSAGTWTVRATVEGREEIVRANAVVTASGLFATPKRLDVPGVNTFAGQIVHTAEWTGNENFAGRDVAIIGNGSTGVQMLAAIRRQARSVTVFQRTPQWISPRERYGEAFTPETRWLLDTMPYYWSWYCYAFATLRLGAQVFQEPDPEWQAAGGLVNEANDGLRKTLTAYIEAKVGSRPDLVEKLTPKHAPMARRMVVDNKWYASLLEDNVELVTDSIEEITPAGIRTADGRVRPLDLIITATGFEVERYLFPADYRGLGGQSIHDFWSDPDGGGPRAYLSLTVPGFPNFFIMYGPNSQNRSGALITSIELWSRYIAQALITTIERGDRYLVVRPEVFEQHNKELDSVMQGLIWYDPASKDRNYYVNHWGRQQVNAPWRIEDHYELLKSFEPDDYEFS